MKAAPKLKGMLTQLQSYIAAVKFILEKICLLLSHTIKSIFVDNSTCGAPEDLETMVYSIVAKLPKTQMKLIKFKSVVAEDMIIPYLKYFINNGFPKFGNSVNSNIQSYWNICDSLHETVFYRCKLVGPQKLE